MIVEFLTVDILFRFINFFLLAAFGVYAFKKYVYHWAKDKIANRKRVIASLKEQKLSLKNRLDELEDEIKEQKHYGVEVHQLTDRWYAAVRHQLQERLEEKKESVFKAEKRVALRSEWLTRHLLQQQVVPFVLDDVQQELEVYFKNKKEGLAFVSHIVDYLKKKGRA